jgi:hypothetical protein
MLPLARCALTAPFHHHRTRPESRFLGCLLSVALSVGSRLPGVTWHPALRSPDFPPSRSKLRNSDRLPGADPAEVAAWGLRRSASRLAVGAGGVCSLFGCESGVFGSELPSGSRVGVGIGVGGRGRGRGRNRYRLVSTQAAFPSPTVPGGHTATASWIGRVRSSTEALQAEVLAGTSIRSWPKPRSLLSTPMPMPIPIPTPTPTPTPDFTPPPPSPSR